MDAPPNLEFAEHVLDLVALAVEQLVMGYLDFSVSFCWDAGFDLAFSQGVTQSVGIVAPVRQQGLGGRQRRQQSRSTGVVADLTRSEKQAAGPPLAVADRMQFRVQPAFGPPDKPG